MGGGVGVRARTLLRHAHRSSHKMVCVCRNSHKMACVCRNSHKMVCSLVCLRQPRVLVGGGVVGRIRLEGPPEERARPAMAARRGAAGAARCARGSGGDAVFCARSAAPRAGGVEGISAFQEKRIQTNVFNRNVSKQTFSVETFSNKRFKEEKEGCRARQSAGVGRANPSKSL